MKIKIINTKTFTIFSLIFLTAAMFFQWSNYPAATKETSIISNKAQKESETKSFSFTLNNESVDLRITAVSSEGIVEYNLSDELSMGTVFELKDNKILVSLYEQSNVVLIDLSTGAIDTVFGNPEPSQLKSDNAYGVIWADILEVLPDKEHVIFYTTRSGDFKVYNFNVYSGKMFEIPEEKYRDIVAWYDSTTAFIAEGLSDLSKEQYTLIKYNFETNQSTVIKTVSSDQIQSLTFYNDSLGA